MRLFCAVLLLTLASFEGCKPKKKDESPAQPGPGNADESVAPQVQTAPKGILKKDSQKSQGPKKSVNFKKDLVSVKPIPGKIASLESYEEGVVEVKDLQMQAVLKIFKDLEAMSAGRHAFAGIDACLPADGKIALKGVDGGPVVFDVSRRDKIQGKLGDRQFSLKFIPDEVAVLKGKIFQAVALKYLGPESVIKYFDVSESVDANCSAFMVVTESTGRSIDTTPKSVENVGVRLLILAEKLHSLGLMCTDDFVRSLSLSNSADSEKTLKLSNFHTFDLFVSPGPGSLPLHRSVAKCETNRRTGLIASACVSRLMDAQSILTFLKPMDSDRAAEVFVRHITRLMDDASYSEDIDYEIFRGMMDE
jgi:hypothetical protein